MQIDEIDRKIMATLQADSAQPIGDVAEHVGLSLSACARRIKSLEERHYIDGYCARLNGERLGYKMVFLVEVSLDSQTGKALAAFEKEALERPEVLECYLMTGDADYLLKVAAKDTADFEQRYRRAIASLPHVTKIQSALIMKTVKPWRGFPTHD